MSEVDISKRIQMAAKIRQSPREYKVCEGCGSIVLAKAHVCPNCNAYRFNLDPLYVIEQADLLAARDPLSIDRSDYQ